MRSSRSSKNQPAPAPTEKLLVGAHLLSTFLIAIAFAAALAQLFFPLDSGWPMAALILLATIGTLVALTRQLPLQNVLLAAFGIALIGGGISTLGVTTGIPFGPMMFGLAAGPKIFNTLPWGVPLLWIIVVLNSRGAGRLILRPWRKTKTYGYWLIGLTAVLVLLFDLALEPFASRANHYWLWLPTKFPVTWQGAPLVNFLCWGAVTLLMLAFVTPTLINKQLSKRRVLNYQSLGIWLAAILLFGVSSVQHGLWTAAAVDGAIALVTVIFAVRGARW